jgi:hypothetical protein
MRGHSSRRKVDRRGRPDADAARHVTRLQFGIDCGGESKADVDLFADDDGKTGELEGQPVVAGRNC